MNKCVCVCVCVCVCCKCVDREGKWIIFQTKVISNQIYIMYKLIPKGNAKSSLVLLLVMKELTWDYANDV
jgi:hypothetical protein